MSVRRTTNNAFQGSSLSQKRLMALLAAIALACAVLWGATAISESAYAALYEADGTEQVEGESADTAAEGDESVQVEGVVVYDGSEAEGDSDSDGTVIEDEENPMSSGLEGTIYDHSGGVPLYMFVGLAIVAVAVFFIASTHRLNADIIKMNRKIR